MGDEKLRDCLLRSIHEEASYFCELVQEMGAAGKRVRECLQTLKKEGLIVAKAHRKKGQRGPGRQCYYITAAGASVLQE